jgi:hypothetical protein
MVVRSLRVKRCGDRKPERSQANGQRRVQCCCSKRATQPDMFVANVRRERSGADYPSGQPPRNSLLTGRSRSGECPEDNAGKRVQDAHE